MKSISHRIETKQKPFRYIHLYISNMLPLTHKESREILQRFPKFELSYETIPHKKVLPKYNLCIATPCGTKAFAWFTHFGVNDACFIMETNKEKKMRLTFLRMVKKHSVEKEKTASIRSIHLKRR